MPLLETSLFEVLFLPLRGKRVGFVPLDGNVGDRLNHAATEQLFEYFEIEHEVLSPLAIDQGSIAHRFDELVVSGGGNMGGPFYKRPFQTRQELIGTGLPIHIFPQSFIQNEEDLSPYARVFVRDEASRALNPHLPLAPDLAMGYRGPVSSRSPCANVGLFLRRDVEHRIGEHPASLGDPAALADTVDELFDLASHFRHIVTDRLHFCIAALLLGKEVTLLPNSYFKNRSFYDTWLSTHCQWSEDVPALDFERADSDTDLFIRLTGPPSRVIDRSCIPVKDPGFFLDQTSEPYKISHADGVRYIESNSAGALVWQLCDGERSTGEIVSLITEAVPQPPLEVAYDIQLCLGQLAAFDAITLDFKQDTSRDGDVVRPNLAAPEIAVRRRRALDLQVHEPQIVEGRLRCSATLDGTPLWFATDPSLRDAVSPHADPFLLTSLMIAMHSGRPLSVRGAPVTKGLTRNLEQFQAVWSAWRNKLVEVEIEAEEMALYASPRGGAIAGFSGGVDSSYTIYRHLVSPDTRRGPQIRGALTIHGFDIASEDREKFATAFDNARRYLDGLDVDLLSVETNAKPLLPNWLDSHGLLLASCLSLFAHRFETGVIAATLPYVILQPLGSNPTTDWLMGSDHFSIFHHGAAVSRLDKVRAIAEWNAVDAHLRVCWEGESATDLNCGSCLSCVLTAIMFHCLGHRPKCLPDKVSAAMASNVLQRNLGRLEWYDLRCIVAEANRRGLQADWLEPLKTALAKSEMVLEESY